MLSLLRAILKPTYENGASVVEVEVAKAADTRVKACFMDPMGNHVLVNLRTGGQVETHYLHKRYHLGRTTPCTRRRVPATPACHHVTMQCHLLATSTAPTQANAAHAMPSPFLYLNSEECRMGTPHPPQPLLAIAQALGSEP